MSQYFSKPYEPFVGDINIKVDLSNYATKTDLVKAIGIDTFNLALKSNLAKLKAGVDKIDVDKLKIVPTDLSKPSNVVDNEVVKKTVHAKLVTKLDNIDTSGFALEAKYNTDKSDLEMKISDADKKIPDISGIAKKTDYNAKITEIEGKIHSITGLATTVALTVVENKISNVNNLLKKKQIMTQKY